MTAAAEKNTDIAARVEFYSTRVPEELYDTATDPDCRKNLITDPAESGRIVFLHSKLGDHLRESGDPRATEYFKN